MDERFQTILDSLPPKLPRSRLEPYWELIRELRRRGRTYREIAQLLAEKFEITVAPSTVHDFVRVRTRRRQRPQQVELPTADAAVSETPPTRIDGEAVTTTEISERIEAVKRRPPPEKAPKRRFEYDETAQAGSKKQ